MGGASMGRTRFLGTRWGLGVAFVIWVAFSSLVHAEPVRPTDSRSCLLIIDVQEFYFPGGAMPLDAPEAAALNCKKLLDKFRGENRLVVHVGHNTSKGVSFHADVSPQEGEKVIMKNEVNAFEGTDLLDYLRKNGVRRLVICGMQTHMCVEAAVRAAHDLGFECVLVHDACAARDVKFGDKTIGAADVHHSTLATLDRNYAEVVDTETFVKTD